MRGANLVVVNDADTFFGVELPSPLLVWVFGPEQAAAIDQPVLSVRGAETQPVWVEIADFLRSSLRSSVPSQSLERWRS